MAIGRKVHNENLPFSGRHKGRYFVNLTGDYRRSFCRRLFTRACIKIRRSRGKRFTIRREGSHIIRQWRGNFWRASFSAASARLTDGRSTVCPRHHFSPFFPAQIAQWTGRPAGGQFVWMDNDSLGRAQCPAVSRINRLASARNAEDGAPRWTCPAEKRRCSIQP